VRSSQPSAIRLDSSGAEADRAPVATARCWSTAPLRRARGQVATSSTDSPPTCAAARPRPARGEVGHQCRWPPAR
jgi:hypothetical protein